MSESPTGSTSPADAAEAEVPELDELESAIPQKPAPRPAPRQPFELPTVRSFDPPPERVLLPQKESWEPQPRATRRPEFADRVTRTTEPALHREAFVAPKPPPRRTGAITWEREAPPERDPEEAEEEGLSDRQLWTLASLAILVFLLSIAWAVKSLFGRPTGEVPPAVVPAPVSLVEGAVSGELSEADYKAAVEIASKFLASATVDEAMAFTRDAQRLRPLMDEFYKVSPWRASVGRRFAPRDIFQTKGPMIAGMVELEDFSRAPVAFLRTPDGIKVDWESFVGHGEVPWDKLAERRPTRSVLMRVRLAPDDYYNLDFNDAKTHACYRLMSHDAAHRIYGYARRDSAVHARLLARAPGPGAFIMPTVRIRFKEGGLSSDQVEITAVISDGWILTEEDEESSTLPSPAAGLPDPSPRDESTGASPPVSESR